MARGELSLYPDLAIVMAENGYAYSDYVAAANDRVKIFLSIVQETNYENYFLTRS